MSEKCYWQQGGKAHRHLISDLKKEQIHRMSFNSFQVAFLVLLSPIPSLHIEIEKKACLYLSFSFLLNEHI